MRRRGSPPGARIEDRRCPPQLETAWGYQGNALALPVADVDKAVPFYERIMGFAVVSRTDAPHRSVVLSRNGIQIGMAENGGDPTQDGCAFQQRQ